MKKLVWRDDRLAWPLVIGIAYAAVALMVCDYIWRMVVMPFETLVLFLALGNVVAILVIYGIYKAIPDKKETGI